MKIIIFVIICSFYVFQSCSKVIDHDFTEIASKPVVNCLFTADKPMNIYLGYSSDILGKKMIYYTKATGSLYEDGILFDTLRFDKVSQLLFSAKELASGKIYSIDILLNDSLRITATDTIPNKPVINSFQYIDSSYIYDEGSYVSKAVLSFNDFLEQKNFYEVHLYLMYHDTINDIFEKYRISVLSNNIDPIIDNEQISDFNPEFLIFSDVLISKPIVNLNVDFSTPSYKYYYNPAILVELKAVSFQYYKFKKQLLKHENSQEDDFWSHVEPVNMYSNIEGGYGIFAAYNATTDTVFKYSK